MKILKQLKNKARPLWESLFKGFHLPVVLRGRLSLESPAPLLSKILVMSEIKKDGSIDYRGLEYVTSVLMNPYQEKFPITGKHFVNAIPTCLRCDIKCLLLTVDVPISHFGLFLANLEGELDRNGCVALVFLETLKTCERAFLDPKMYFFGRAKPVYFHSDQNIDISKVDLNKTLDIHEPFYRVLSDEDKMIVWGRKLLPVSEPYMYHSVQRTHCLN